MFTQFKTVLCLLSTVLVGGRVLFVGLLFAFWDRISLGSPGWSGTHGVVVSLREMPLPLLGLKVCTATPGSYGVFWSEFNPKKIKWKPRPKALWHLEGGGRRIHHSRPAWTTSYKTCLSEGGKEEEWKGKEGEGRRKGEKEGKEDLWLTLMSSYIIVYLKGFICSGFYYSPKE